MRFGIGMKAIYTDRFVELLEAAVNDRLRTDRVGVYMSGGMDSTTIAATANRLLKKKDTRFDLRAFTIVYDRLIPDEERYYSGIVAESLGIPIHYLTADDYQLYERYSEPELCKPEPVHSPLAAMNVDQYRQIAAHTE
jgi:asparagine synthase (glutamine-hydrolysing)